MPTEEYMHGASNLDHRRVGHAETAVLSFWTLNPYALLNPSSPKALNPKSLKL